MYWTTLLFIPYALYASTTTCLIRSKTIISTDNDHYEVFVMNQKASHQHVGNTSHPLHIELIEEVPENGSTTHQYHLKHPKSRQPITITEHIQLTGCIASNIEYDAPNDTNAILITSPKIETQYIIPEQKDPPPKKASPKHITQKNHRMQKSIPSSKWRHDHFLTHRIIEHPLH